MKQNLRRLVLLIVVLVVVALAISWSPIALQIAWRVVWFVVVVLATIGVILFVKENPLLTVGVLLLLLVIYLVSR